MFFLKKIPILRDNYIWILIDSNSFCVIIDPGDDEIVIKEIKKKKWHPVSILLTHNHIDHTAGAQKIVQHYPQITVFGPDETKKNNVDKILKNRDKIILLNRTFYVFFTPGHTPGHISYYSPPYLFCGDTIFSGGCGRVYKNKYYEMYHSIKLLSCLPNNTIICCSHEYTLSNLKFTMLFLPNDQIIRLYFQKMRYRLKLGKSSLPSYLIFEKRINLFLRTDELFLKQALGLQKENSSLETFIELRIRKDCFWS